MPSTDEIKQVSKILGPAQKIVIIQADNPDGDSLASALALEQILGDMGKEPFLYCAVDIPTYLRHLKGWDRVSSEFPAKFDLSIVVDTSSILLLEKLEASRYRGGVAAKPVIVIDHHSDVKCDIPYATLVMNDKTAVATGEAIYNLAVKSGWKLNLQAKAYIVSSILSDSLGLAAEGTTPQTYRIIADLIEGGVDRQALDEARKAFIKMPESIFHYKAELINRTEFAANGRIAHVSIPEEELTKYSPLYNPAPLIQGDMLLTENVLVAIVFKYYEGGRITGSIRCNSGGQVAAELASQFGGGGHAFAAGFKLNKPNEFTQVKSEVIAACTELLDKISDNETL